MRKNSNRKPTCIIVSVLLVCGILSSFFGESEANNKTEVKQNKQVEERVSSPKVKKEEKVIKKTTLKTIPKYNGEPYIEINNNNPYFKKSDYTTKAFEHYSDLDELGRPGVAYANICKKLMPTEERQSIGMVKPVGWQTVKYDWVEGKYLYNRCHIIGFQLAGENANEKNLLTGTRSLNIKGNLPFENEVAEYVKRTGNHVLYRVTPIYKDDNLLCSGELMEGYSVEDNGQGVKFCIYAFNEEPGVIINHKTGDNKSDGTYASSVDETKKEDFILNTRSMVIHRPSCRSLPEPQNKKKVHSSIEILKDNGYRPCGNCM